MMFIPDNIKFILEKLNNSGFEAYIVGGCVRDILLDKIPNDYDVTTNALPEEIKEVFSSCKIIDNNGEKHGTVTVRYNHENIEITTFRCDGDYADHRHPNEVNFTKNLKEDLARRDFTINAMAFDINGNLYDYYDGKEDIKNKIVKAVGEPHKRFDEDALRILRGLRFASVLDFDIDKDTLDAMYTLKSTLSFVSKERIKVELDKMVCGIAFTKIARDIKAREIIAEIIPELRDMFGFDQKSKYHPNDLYVHTLNVVEHVESNHILKLSALFHDIGKTVCYQVDEKDSEIYHFIGHEEKSKEIALRNLKNLRYSSDEIEKISFLVLYHDYWFSTKLKSMRKFMSHLPEKDSDLLVDYLVSLKKADRLDHTSVNDFNLDIIKENYNIIKNDINECYNVKTLKVDGNDLISLGYSGKKIGEILNKVLDLVIDGKLQNDKEKLIAYIKNNN